jgi:outer membrane phospholipase A
VRALAAALALAVAAGAAAQEAQWVIVSAEPRLHAGERFDLTLIAPPGEPLPDEIPVVVRAGPADVLVAMNAAAPAQDGRRRYFATLPEGMAGAVTLSLAGRASNSLVLLVARGDAMDALTLGDEPPLSQNDPIYFIVGTRGGTSARFQLSFKYRLFDTGSGFGRERPWLAGLYFAYTQNSIWDLESSSKPFRDTSYRPSLFWSWRRTDEKTWIDGARLGFEHESNGKEGELSRSLNTAFVRPEWRWQLGEGKLDFTPRVNAYLDNDENPDIEEYRGYVDWRARFDSGGLWVATAEVRYGTAGKGSVLIDLSRRTRDLRLGPVSGYLHLQFFAGYGEDILNYNVRNKSQLRLGFAIVP